MSAAPPDPHADLDRFADGELPPEEAERFRAHLAGCARCQAALPGRVQLAGLSQDTLAGEETSGAGADLDPRRPEQDAPAAAQPPGAVADLASRRPEGAPAAAPSPGATVLRPARWRARAAAAVGVALAAGLAVVIAGRIGGEPDPSLWLADRPARAVEARLGTPAADLHRPYEVARGAEAAPAPPLPELAKLDSKERWVAIADAYLARGAPETARPYLDRAGGAPDALASRAAMDLMLGQPVEALHHANQALAKKPDLRPATWNLALALRALGLSLAAAQQLDKVAAAGEPGWSAEAKALAEQLRADVQRRKDHWIEVVDACLRAASGEAPFPADLKGVPLPVWRLCFDDALARAGTAEELKRLLPAAEALDKRSGGDGARRAVQRALAQPLQEREAVAREYTSVMTSQRGPGQESLLALADRAKQARQRDIELQALLLAPAKRIPPERLQALATATADPWYLSLAENQAAQALMAAGDRGSAQALIAARVKVCEGIDRPELDCPAAARILLTLYELPRQRAEALATGARAMEQARREGDVDAQLRLFSVMANVTRESDPDLSAAYFSEHTRWTTITP